MPLASSKNYDSVGSKILRKVSMATAVAVIAANAPVWQGLKYQFFDEVKTVQSADEFAYLKRCGYFADIE